MRKSKHRDERPSARLDWEGLRVFAAVAEAGSVNKAAERLKIRPSSVSRQIDKLEQRLEAKLFQRSTAGMTLTQAGEEAYDRALSMQRFADDIERNVRARDRREEGLVTIAAPDGVGSLWIAPRIGDFLNSNPKIQISLDCLTGPQARDQDQRPDITIALDKSVAQIGDDAMTLATMHYVFAASPRYIETYGAPKSAASAAGDHRTVRQTGQTAQRESWSKRATAVETLASFSFETNSSAAMVSALRNGAGVATVPSYLFTIVPDLVIIGEEASVPIRLWLVVHKEARNAARARRAAEWLRTIFDTRANPWFRDEFVHPAEFDAQSAPLEGAKPARTRRGAS